MTELSNEPEGEAPESSLSDLFGRDPLLLTKKDRGQIIAYFRQKRAEFMNKPAPATKAAKAPKDPNAPKKPKITGLSLDDLLG